MSEPAAPAARRPLSLADATVIASIGSLATILLSVVQSKVTAVLLGPVGVGELAELRQVATTVLVPLAIFNGPPFVALLAEAHGRGDRKAEQRVYDVLSTVALVAGVVLGAAVALFGATATPGAGFALLLAGMGGAAATWRVLPSQALLAVHDLRTSTLITVLASVVTAGLVCWGTYAWGVVGQLAAGLVAALVTWPLGLAMARRAYPTLRMVPRPRLDGPILRRALGLGGAFLISTFIAQGSLSVVRWALHRTGGAEENGQFQAAWLVGTGYLAFLLGGLGNVAFPRYASATTAEALSEHVDEASRFVLRTAPPVVLLAIALRAPAVRILYSGRFGETTEVLGIMMAGDVSKALSYVQAGPLLYRGPIRTFVATEAVTGVLQAVAALLLVPHFGAVGAGWACTISYVVYALVTSFVTERACGIRVDRRRALSATMFAAAGVASVQVTADRPILQVALAAAALAMAHRAGLLQAAVQRARRMLSRTRS